MCRLVFVTWFSLAIIVRIQAQNVKEARMQAIDRALGVECAHCHTGEDWKRADKPEFAFAETNDQNDGGPQRLELCSILAA